MNLFWFRRDLRIEDNAGLYHALKSKEKVQPIFIFDEHILNKLNDKSDKRLLFIYQTIQVLKNELIALGSDLWVYYGDPILVFKELLATHKIQQVFTNRDYEPYALKRDSIVKELLESNHINFQTFKDHVIFEKDEVLKDDGTPYTVYTPYSKKWKSKLTSFYLKPYPTEKYLSYLNQGLPHTLMSIESLGFKNSEFIFPSLEIKQGVIKLYEKQRDIPSIAGTSKLSLHFRFGTVSIRAKAAKGQILSEKWLNELIWRDFYSQILAHFPHIEKSAFKPAYDKIEWRNNEVEFEQWCNGQTGYPIVDAGMRELNTTGFMHNRVRMIVASFLTKHLLIDWRWGEAYFAEKLLDFDLASNNGGWQWAAGSGVDAAPYFRVFNPYLQTDRFDPEHLYIKHWVPEFLTPDYPSPIVEHTFARNRCLQVYKQGLSS
ncbi:MAG: deoxyribodipyrimidine photo-lyase [bacterium]|nr:deoxyribodipyrimidine photo-lyase [bacterium]